ncbi:winged helix-turn-helix domain-containing protein, partial [Paenibacillus sp. TAF58]
SMHEMSARVHALIRRSNLYLKSRANTHQVTEVAGGSTTAVLEAVLDIDKKITLNPNTRSMRVHGVLVETTYSEFEIMKCFVHHPGRVYSREDLLQTVRGFDCLVTDRAIDVHIANLRKKIEDNPKEPKWIRTVWGVGYKFVY